MRYLVAALVGLALGACVGPTATSRPNGAGPTEPIIRDASGLVTQTVVLSDIRSMAGDDQEIAATNPDETRLSIDVVWRAAACQRTPVVEIADDGLRFSITVYRGSLADACTAGEVFRGVRLILAEPRDAQFANLTAFDPPDPPASFSRE